jgi:hypothetical protein
MQRHNNIFFPLLILILGGCIPMEHANVDITNQYKALFNSGLKVQGVRAYPKKLSLESIQPVYLINPFPIQREKSALVYVDLSATAGHEFAIVNCTQIDVEVATVTDMYIVINYDAAARAAAVVADHHPDIFLYLYDPANVGVPYFVHLGVIRFQIGAYAAHVAIAEWDMHSISSFTPLPGGSAGTFITAFKSCNFPEIKIRRGCYLSIQVEGRNGVNFPATTTATLHYRYTY